MLGESVAAPVGRVRQRRAETRARILTEAWQTCREQGLTSLSLRDLAARVGMRAPSLYSYFGSKDDIYDAMFAQGQRELMAALAHLPEGGGGRATFHEGARAFFRFCTDDPVRYQLMFQRVVPGFVPSPDSYALALGVFARLRRAMESLGVTDPGLIDLWTAILTGLTDQQISNDPGGERWARLLDQAVDLFCDHAGVA